MNAPVRIIVCTTVSNVSLTKYHDVSTLSGHAHELKQSWLRTHMTHDGRLRFDVCPQRNWGALQTLRGIDFQETVLHVTSATETRKSDSDNKNTTAAWHRVEDAKETAYLASK